MVRSPRLRTALAATFFIAAAFLLGVGASASLAADVSSPDWLRGSGKNLELCLQGEVLDSDGKPATDFQLTGTMDSSITKQPLKPALDGHRFKIWIPVNQPHWYSISISATSAHSPRVANQFFNEYQLRQAATDGVKLKLQTPTRHFNVKVTDQGQPVAGAVVKAELSFGGELRATTDNTGTAHFRLLRQQELSHLTAWTDDHRIGGFSFGRDPPRDPDADEYAIELSKCRDQKIRFVAEDGSPVPGIDFVVEIATPSPNFNFIGICEHSHLTTDANGEAVCKWFPDWEKVHTYVDIDENPWVLDGDPKFVDGVEVIRVKKSKQRHRIVGRVVPDGVNIGAGGFFVSLGSFAGERENHSDMISAFSNLDGTFAIDVLPDAAYCAFVQDNHWVGKMIDFIPYESGSEKKASPELTVSEGQPVEVTVTAGPANNPIPNLSISFRRDHEYSWHENGKIRHGIGAADWWVTTDESGKISTRTLPGKLEVSVYTPRWRDEKTITVVEGKPATVTLHREIGEKRTVTGRLVLDEGVPGTLKDAQIRIGSTDGNYQDQQSLICAPHGSFSFDTFAASIAVFARTEDGSAAGTIVTKDLASPIEIRLIPTTNYDGQLLDKYGKPAVGHSVHVLVRLEGEKKPNSRYSQMFEAAQIEASTDGQGNFTLRGIPSRVKANLYADIVDGVSSIYLSEIYLEPNKARTRIVSQLEKTASTPAKTPLAERYRTMLRDCALGGYRLLVIVADDHEAVADFVDKNYADYDTNKEVYPFMQLVVTGGITPLKNADAEFLQKQNWPLPQPGHVAAYAIDANGKELGHQQIDVAKDGAAREVAEFIHVQAPERHDAQEAWVAAFAEAKRTNRSVWVRISQRYCGPCIRMSRWLDDQHKLLEKDYVMLKIDDVRDKNGNAVAQRVVHGEGFSIPFHAIFDTAEKMLIDSTGPEGNVGYASGPEGKKQLRKMLLETRHNLTDAEIDQLVESLGN